MSEKLYSCIILSGGMSRRMGEDKGSMIIQGKPMILHILERLNGKINDAVIVLNNQERINSYNELLNAYVPVKIEENFTYSLEFIEDEVKDKGPVAGIMTGLKNIKTDYALVLPCDSPFISEYNIKTMFDLLESSENTDAVIPYHTKANKDRLKNKREFNFKSSSEMSRYMKIENSEPLHSIYKKDNLDIISKLLEDDNLYVKSFIKNLKCVNFVEVDNEVLFEDDFKNFNRKEDIESFE